ncbi:hypothetical protein FOA52_004445 [Chlamydomonas sp. UWO 241]|nr:hypothetical protein FOA52_004445 [Chlamydomonas sp. UWO 241]
MPRVDASDSFLEKAHVSCGRWCIASMHPRGDSALSCIGLGMNANGSRAAGRAMRLMPAALIVATCVGIMLLVCTPTSNGGSQHTTDAQVASYDTEISIADAVDGSIPRIIHHMHKNLDALSNTQRLLRARCMELHPGWEFRFWDDDSLNEFVETKFAWYHDTWMEINPLIKKLDSSRYMLMHHYGGIYLDVDAECVTPFDSMVEHLPRYAAWTGDFPEPMFVMSAPGNEFWLHALNRIKRVWKDLDAWHATGPVNRQLQRGAGKHVDVLKKSAVVPLPASWRIGFIANELLDPVSCSEAELAHCVDALCKDSWPLSYVVRSDRDHTLAARPKAVGYQNSSRLEGC